MVLNICITRVKRSQSTVPDYWLMKSWRQSLQALYINKLSISTS